MRSWLTLLSMVVAQTAGLTARPTATDAQSGQPVNCCCEAGSCSCGCLPASEQNSHSEEHAATTFCSCEDQPLAVPELPHVQVARLLELGVRAIAADARCPDLYDGPPSASPRAHGRPPNLALVTTFILLS